MATTEILRTVIHSNQLASVIDLPAGLQDQDVEVIVLPLAKLSKQNKLSESPSEVDLKKLRGCLKQYANPKLRELANGAWKRTATEKYLENKHEYSGH
jgi:hypothetical protein